MTKIAHRLIARTAKEITVAAWEIMSSDNAFHRAWPDHRRFVARQWKNFVGHARACLVAQLTDPNISEIAKEAIYEALVTEGAYKETPMAPMPSLSGKVPTPSELIRFGGLN